MLIAETLRAVIIYTDPTHAQKVAEDCLKHNNVPYTYLRDEYSNVWGILFDTFVLNLETHEISIIH